MVKKRLSAILSVILTLAVGLACQLTSPTPASWVGTPTARAREATNAAVNKTLDAIGDEDTEFVPSPEPEQTRTAPTATQEIPADGPWLIYVSPADDGLRAFDMDTHDVLGISLPAPIYSSDIDKGISPDGKQLAIRAGSPENFDELGIYLVDLPSLEPVMISPLLSLGLQRDIVNQEGTRALETLQAVTRPDGLAWSPDGRFLAFNAALDNDSSDLYVWDTLNQRVERLNGLYTQNASPFWSPSSLWLITQELGNYAPDSGWRSENVTGLQVPGYDDQNSLYIPSLRSLEEVFIGWLTPQDFVSYSNTLDGPSNLKQVNVELQEATILFDGFFNQVVFDPESRTIGLIINEEQAAVKGLEAGVYLLQPDAPFLALQRAGDWQQIVLDSGKRFVVSGFQGAYVFDLEGGSILLPGEKYVLLSPGNNWMLAWGDSDGSNIGLRLYQPDSEHALQTVVEGKIQNVVWAPDSKAFFVLSEGVLSRLAFPSLNPVVIESGFPQEGLLDFAWLE